MQLKAVGYALAKLPDASIYTNDISIAAGCVEGGRSAKSVLLDDSRDYAAVITYKMNPVRPHAGQDAHISSYPNLQLFTEVAVKSTYARGIDMDA